jgi:hypothetical protein
LLRESTRKARFMRTLLRYSIVHCFLGLAIDSGLAQTPPPPMPPEIQVELNKLEPAGIACRGYFVVSNGVSEPLKELRLDVFLFDRAGIILRRFGLTFLDIRAERSKVVLFDLPEVECGNVGRLVVNDVIACTVASEAPLAGCSTRVRTSTRAGVPFTY